MERNLLNSSNEARPYSVLLALSRAGGEENHLDAWVHLAISLLREPGEVRLRGMITIPPDQSLSEGTTQARQLREALQQVAREHLIVHDETEVRVDYRPLARVIDELRDLPTDLLLVQWNGPAETTGGVTTDEILQHAPCDVALVSGDSWQSEGPILLSLRGGPNMALSLQVAKALAGKDTITLFHAADNRMSPPDLRGLMKSDPLITRAVTAFSEITDGILRESAGHKAIVLGATFNQPEIKASALGPVISRIYEQVDRPLVLVRAWHPGSPEFNITRSRWLTEVDLSTQVDRWFAENTFHSFEFNDLKALVTLKEQQGVTISIGLPALNEGETVGKVISTLKTALMDEVPLVDEIVLIDSDSTDDTVTIAQSLGVPAYKHPEILPEMGSNRGKGEALWKSLHVLKGDLVAWIDTDITNIHPRFIYGLIGPLLKRPNVQYVKGFYQRPIRVGGQLQARGGGRVTELVARPLLNLFYPELSGIVQPLSGEYAGRRAALETIPFFSGYGVETGMLIDLHERYGLEAIAQADLEERVHHNQPLIGLSKMSFAILQVFIARLENRYGVRLLDRANRSMKLIAQEEDRLALDIEQIGDVERPAMITIPAYRKSRCLNEE
jgi:glucosyl-3-phosphoglycerate synthase